MSTYSATGVLVRLGNNYGFYVHVDEDMTVKTPALRRNASMAYSNVIGSCYNTPTVMDTVANIFDYDPNIRPTKLKGLRSYTKAKVTGQHHTHLRPQDVLNAAKKSSQRDYYYVMCIVELLADAAISVESTVSTIMLYVLMASDTSRELFMDSRAIWVGTNGEENLASRLKLVSSQIKSIHTSDLEPLTEFFELLVLMNRGIGNVDWHAERENRTNPNTVDVDQKELTGSSEKCLRIPRNPMNILA